MAAESGEAEDVKLSLSSAFLLAMLLIGTSLIYSGLQLAVVRSQGI